MASKTRVQLEQWLSKIDVKCDSCLDCGGAQQSIKGRTKSWDVKDYKILDLEQPHECKQKPDIIGDINYPLIGNTDGPVDVYKQTEDSKKYMSWGIKKQIIKPFNIVFCIEAFEYIHNSNESILNISNCLDENGILYLSTHFIYPVHNPVEEDVMRLTPLGIEKLLKEAGFKILEHTPRLATSNKIMEFYREEGMRPAKGYDHTIIGSLIKAQKI